MTEKLKERLDEWKKHRSLTLDLLDEIEEEKLGFTVGNNMGTLGKQFRHIGDVQLCYNFGIVTGKINFDQYRRDYSIESSKEKLREFLEEVNDEMFKLIEENKDRVINWGHDKLSIESHVNYLIQHEILHHGELVVYIRTLGMKFPKSWGIWGL